MNYDISISFRSRMFFSRFACSTLRNSSFSTSAKVFSAPKSNLAKLRKKTGYSLTLCKKALENANQDVQKAEQWLKVKTKTFIVMAPETFFNDFRNKLWSKDGPRLKSSKAGTQRKV